TSIRVLAAGTCAFAGAMRLIAGMAPNPRAATPAARNVRRAGLARGGSQHGHMRKNLSAELARIPFLAIVVLRAYPWLRPCARPATRRPTTSGRVHERVDVAISSVADARFARAQTTDPPGDTSPRQRTAAIRRVRAIRPAEPSRQRVRPRHARSF